MKKVEFARELECSPSSITTMIAKGMPKAPDGSLDRKRCLRWILKYSTGKDGGWGKSGRGPSLEERAQALLSGETKGAATADDILRSVAAKCWKPPHTTKKPAVPPLPVVTSGSDAHAAAVATLREITAPAQVLRFARVAVRAGATPMLAYIVAQWFLISPCLDLNTISADDLVAFPEVTRAQWRKLLGKDFDLEVAEDLYESASAPEFTLIKESL